MPDTHVTAKVAADMTGHSERTIRRWLASGKLHARKTARGDWQIRVEDLPAPASRSGHADDQMAALRAEVAALRARISMLERQVNRPIAPVTRSEANLTGQDGQGSNYTAQPVYRVPVPRPVAQDGSIKDRASAARWLGRHGVNELTPKSWPGWRDLDDLTPRGVLSFAMQRCDVTNYRIPWRLHRCDDATCVCWEVLAGAMPS